MFIQVMSTRHTGICTLRRGIVYQLDPKHPKFKKEIAPLMEGDKPAVKKITEKQAKKIAKDVVSLEPDAAEEGLSDKEKLTQTEARARTAEAELEVANSELDKAKDEIEVQKERAEDAEGKLASIGESADKLGAELASAKELISEKDTEIAKLTEDLAKATEPKPAAKK